MRFLLALLASATLLAQSPHLNVSSGPINVVTFTWASHPPAVPGGASLSGAPIAFDGSARTFGLFVSLDHADRGIAAFRVRCDITLEDGQKIAVNEVLQRIDGGRAFGVVAFTGKMRPTKLANFVVTPLRADADVAIPTE